MTFGVDGAIARLADPHGGYVNRKMLLELGLTYEAIRHRVQRGLLLPEYDGVYAVGRIPTQPLDRAAGALLAAGPRSALSHGSAATLWGVFKSWSFPLEVTIPTDRRPQGLIVHHSRLLTQADITNHAGLRVTSPARTFLDVAPRLTKRRRIRAFNELRLAHGLATEDVVSLLARFPRHPGARLVRPIVGDTTTEPTRSYFEDEWPPFARTWNFTGWDMNQYVCGYRVDVIFLPDLLIVELDGKQIHGTPSSFERDREQDSDILARTGIPTLRITHKQFHDNPAQQAERIHSVLAARRARHA